MCQCYIKRPYKRYLEEVFITLKLSFLYRFHCFNFDVVINLSHQNFLIMSLLKNKTKVQLLCAVFLIVAGVGLLITGFCVPPQGEIHNSVLIAFGEILTFVGALFGIDYHYKYKAGDSAQNNKSSKSIENEEN